MRVKYPRTMHMPWSEGISSDDKKISSMESFEGKRVIVTEKMDGENTTMYSDYIHARSIDGRHHPSRDWVKNFWNSIKYEIPTGFRICGENLYAKHSIGYEKLPSYFMGFSVWNDCTCLSWEETVLWFELLDVETVPVLYIGEYDEKIVKEICKSLDTSTVEGCVMRITDSFVYDDFSKNVCKFVRQNHVQTNKHWAHQEIIPNGLI